MATTTEEFKTGTGTTIGFNVEYIKETDIKVRVDGGNELTFTTSSSPTTGQYNIAPNATTITFGDNQNGKSLHIYSAINTTQPIAAFTPGSSIKAADLNRIEDYVRHGLAESRNKIIEQDLRDEVITSAKIKNGTIVDADISASAGIAQSKIATGNLPSGITINSDNIVDGSIVAGDLQTGTLDSRYYTETELDAGQLDNRYYTETELNAGQLDNRYYTETELNAGQLDTRYYTEAELNAGQLDNRYYTETESEALFLRQDSSETIASGETWSGTDSKVATTAAIDARIIDLLDDVGGFVPLANETSFPTANPDINNGAGTVVSVKAVSTNLTPSSGTVTIANGAGTGNTVTLTGVTGVIPQGFGMILETTSTLHTYAFHRLQAKATEITTVASNITNVINCGQNLADIENFADLYQISTTAPTTRADGTALTNGDLWFDSSTNQVMMVYDGSAGDGFSPITPNQATITAINSVSGHVTFQEDLGLVTESVNTGSGNNSINTVGANIASVNTTAGSITNVNTVATNIANVNTTAGSIANVNNVGASIADVNRYANEYVIQSGTPSSPSSGDLWYNSTANQLNYYNGSSWVAIAPGIAGLINDANPALANHLDCNDKNLTEVATVSGNNLQIDFGTL